MKRERQPSLKYKKNEYLYKKRLETLMGLVKKMHYGAFFILAQGRVIDQYINENTLKHAVQNERNWTFFTQYLESLMGGMRELINIADDRIYKRRNSPEKYDEIFLESISDNMIDAIELIDPTTEEYAKKVREKLKSNALREDKNLEVQMEYKKEVEYITAYYQNLIVVAFGANRLFDASIFIDKRLMKRDLEEGDSKIVMTILRYMDPLVIVGKRAFNLYQNRELKCLPSTSPPKDFGVREGSDEEYSFPVSQNHRNKKSDDVGSTGKDRYVRGKNVGSRVFFFYPEDINRCVEEKDERETFECSEILENEIVDLNRAPNEEMEERDGIHENGELLGTVVEKNKKGEIRERTEGFELLSVDSEKLTQGIYKYLKGIVGPGMDTIENEDCEFNVGVFFKGYINHRGKPVHPIVDLVRGARDSDCLEIFDEKRHGMFPFQRFMGGCVEGGFDGVMDEIVDTKTYGDSVSDLVVSESKKMMVGSMVECFITQLLDDEVFCGSLEESFNREFAGFIRERVWNMPGFRESVKSFIRKRVKRQFPCHCNEEKEKEENEKGEPLKKRLKKTES